MFRPTIEFLLSLMSLKFGYGTKKYSFDASGVVQTATQYIGERQDMMQELNRQRFQAKQYICGIIRAALWFSNTFCGTACDLDEEIRIEFDDSYIEGKTERLEGMAAGCARRGSAASMSGPGIWRRNTILRKTRRSPGRRARTRTTPRDRRTTSRRCRISCGGAEPC